MLDVLPLHLGGYRAFFRCDLDRGIAVGNRCFPVIGPLVFICLDAALGEIHRQFRCFFSFHNGRTGKPGRQCKQQQYRDDPSDSITLHIVFSLLFSAGGNDLVGILHCAGSGYNAVASLCQIQGRTHAFIIPADLNPSDLAAVLGADSLFLVSGGLGPAPVRAAGSVFRLEHVQPLFAQRNVRGICCVPYFCFRIRVLCRIVSVVFDRPFGSPCPDSRILLDLFQGRILFGCPGAQSDILVLHIFPGNQEHLAEVFTGKQHGQLFLSKSSFCKRRVQVLAQLGLGEITLEFCVFIPVVVQCPGKENIFTEQVGFLVILCQNPPQDRLNAALCSLRITSEPQIGIPFFFGIAFQSVFSQGARSQQKNRRQEHCQPFFPG